MSRQGTTYLNLGKYLDGENPGSGPQDNTLSEGMNGDKNKIDLAVGPGHNVDGSHKAGVIDGAQLASTCVDGATLEQNSTTKQLRVKDLGITASKIASAAVTKTKLAADTAGSGLMQNADGSLSPKIDNTTVFLNGSGQLSTQTAIVRHRMPIHFSCDAGNGGRPTFNGYVSPASGALGMPMYQGGCIVGFSVVNTAGGVYRRTIAYDDQGTHYFTSGSQISMLDIGTDVFPTVEGVGINEFNFEGAGTIRLGTIIVEFDS